MMHYFKIALLSAPLVLVFIYLAARLASAGWYRSQTEWLKRQKDLYFPKSKVTEGKKG